MARLPVSPGSRKRSSAPAIAATPSGSRSLSVRNAALRSPAASATIPGSTQRKTVTPKAIATDRCPGVHGPSVARSSGDERAGGGEIAHRAAGDEPEPAVEHGEQRDDDRHAEHHPAEERDLHAVVLRMKPRPMTFGGVPMGVARPPTDAANDVISISAVP